MAAQRVTTGELMSAVEASLRERPGVDARIVRFERRISPYGTSFLLEELDVYLSDGSTLHLMFKDLSRQALLEGAERAKPVFLYHPLREIQTYKQILEPASLGTAACYGTSIDELSERYWLFIERVPGVELYQVGEFQIWEEVARWLAGMHAHFEGKVGHLKEQAPLVTYDAEYYGLWIERAANFLRASPARTEIEWLYAHYHTAVEHLSDLPGTFIHGEFYASNVLVQPRAAGHRVCPVDWEVAAIGPGLIDLAALTAGKWKDAQRRALALAYYNALRQQSGWAPSQDEFLTALDWCRLHLAVQWLGWSADWQPPSEHAHDWLGEALSLGRSLLGGR